MFTLSGARSESGSCTVTAAYDPSASSPGFTIEISGGDFTFASWLSMTNNFTAGASFNQGNVKNAAGETLLNTEAWSVVVHDSSSMPDQGSFALNISSPGPTVAGTNGALAYTEAHGSLSAMMPAITGSGASGSVTAQVTF
jgi:hypothetical protein